MGEIAAENATSTSALVIAAHGWSDDESPDPRLSALAEDVALRTSFGQVMMAYHRGSPRYCEALDQLTAVDVVVVPFMTSSGYFCSEVLPRELAKNERYPKVSIRQTAPVGVNGRLVNLVEDRLRQIQETLEIPPTDTTVVIVGHGTTRHEASRRATIDVVEKLVQRHLSLEVIPAFLDDEPAVDDIVERAAGSKLIVIPFLMADGHHALRDVPGRIGLNPTAIDEMPFRGSVNGRTVVYDSAVGTYPEIAEIVAMMATEAP